MDGLGHQETKLETWQAITAGGPAGINFGWKNFYDEDPPPPPGHRLVEVGEILDLDLVICNAHFWSR